MPRRSRLSLPGIPRHIIQRGNNRSACFFAEDDYRFYLDRLAELSKKFGALVHAYVLMNNHVHLLLTPERADSAALTMKHLGQRYVHYINRTYKRSGTLWEGRFRSCLAQAEDYVLACYRYIELNPVRAERVRHPREYRWSSYRANAEGKVDELVSPHEEYRRLGRDPRERREAYRAPFKVHLDGALVERIREATNGNYALGNQRFQAEIERALGRRATRGKAGRRPKARAEHHSKQLGLL
jgi:putative transposase